MRRKTVGTHRWAGMRWRAVALVALVAATGLVAAGCREAADPLAAPTIYYGEDICDECGMVISEERYAAATVVEPAPGETRALKFDDIGDMLQHHQRQPELTVLKWYVHDHETLEWLDATTALYVEADELATPMGFGLAAARDRAAADALAAELGGTVLTWDDLTASE